MIELDIISCNEVSGGLNPPRNALWDPLTQEWKLPGSDDMPAPGSNALGAIRR